MQDDFFSGDDGFEDAFEGGGASVAALGRLAGLIRRIDWFGRVGTPPDRLSRRLGADYLSALGFPDFHVAFIEDWRDAMGAAESAGFDSLAWDQEEQLRAALAQEALMLMDEEELSAALEAIGAVTAPVAHQAAQDLADRLGIEDEDFLVAAVGAAVRASHQAALVILAGLDAAEGGTAIPFALRFRLFENGRWPVGLAGASLTIF